MEWIESRMEWRNLPKLLAMEDIYERISENFCFDISNRANSQFNNLVFVI